MVVAGATPIVVGLGRAGRRRRLDPRLAVSRLALVGLAILIPLLGLEFSFRLAGPFLPGDYQTASFVAPSAVVGRQNKPNVAGWRHTAEFTTWLRVNSKGLRGPEVEYAKPPGTFRILVLGDELLAWSPGGYRERRRRPKGEEVRVLTPPSTVKAIRAGYAPDLRPSTWALT